MEFNYPMPQLAGGTSLLVGMAEVIYPRMVREGQDGYQLWAEGTGPDPYETAHRTAEVQFQTVVGVLRAWQPSLGESPEEQWGPLGPVGRDAAGNVYTGAGTVVAVAAVGGGVARWVVDGVPVEVVVESVEEHLVFANKSARAMQASEALSSALYLFGKPGSEPADWYVIYEHAENEFGGSNGIKERLGISEDRQSRFTQSAQRDRHAPKPADPPAPLSVAEQRECIADLLKKWIGYLTRDS